MILSVTPQIIYHKREFTMGEAFRKGILTKTPTGFKTTAQAIRFYVTAERGAQRKVANLFVGFDSLSTGSVDASLFPSELNGVGEESGFMFAALQAYVIRDIKQIEALYFDGFVQSVRVINAENIQNGLEMNIKETKKPRKVIKKIKKNIRRRRVV